MDKLSAYNIAFKGLSPGKHEFDYKIDSRFFDLFDGRFVEEGDVDARITLIKENSVQTLFFVIEGTVELTCDRCLETYHQPVFFQTKVFLKAGDKASPGEDEIIWLAPEEYQVNVAELIYEFIVLSLPIKHIHPENAEGVSMCNPVMLEKLKQYSSPDPDQVSDIRWNELKKLIDNN